jgi:predicted phosphodiesterase
VLGGLIPGAQYEYRVPTAAGFTEWQAFRSRSDDRSAPFEFAVFGDMGDGSPDEARVAERLAQLAPNFTVAVGDLAYPKGTEQLLTERFFGPLRAYAAGHTIWHVFGNHDVAADGGLPLALASSTPANGPPGLPKHYNYSFDYGSGHFVAVDSNLTVPVLQGQVIPWLTQDLERTKQAWKFVFMHHPPFSVGRHGDALKIQKTLVPVFEKSGVDIVFAGHDHHYQRFEPQNGVLYIVTGAGGAGLYRFAKPSLGTVAVKENRSHGLTLMRVEGDHATLRQITDTGKEIDRVELKARPD